MIKLGFIYLVYFYYYDHLVKKDSPDSFYNNIVLSEMKYNIYSEFSCNS